jgi:hypothetical protein
MKVACYIGDHAKDDILTRIGWALTRLVQKGKYRHVTHTEAILAEHADGTVDIGSASLRDGGVRTKRNVRLNPKHWLIADVPQWPVEDTIAWFIEHDGEDYDRRGAFASWLPIMWQMLKEWFCSECLAAIAKLATPSLYGPALFADIAFSQGRDVTAEFFAART